MSGNKKKNRLIKNGSIRKLGMLGLICMSVVYTACGNTQNVEVVSFHTEKQEAYLNDDYKNYKLYANGTEEQSIPDAVSFGFEGDGSSEYTVYISENEDLSDAKAYKTNITSVDVYNLKINQIYYYQVKGETYTSEVKQVKTDAKGPRNLYVEGVTNVRDIGGWKIGEESEVKQGVIFRSSKFNDDESETLLITDKGIDTLVNELKVRTEIDLRTVADNENGGIQKSPLGEEVMYVSIPFESGGNILLMNRDKLKELFDVFGDESNYPIVFHCSIGTDRTGLVAFLINGLMGVSEEELYRDYLFSNFGEIGSVRTPSSIKTYIQTVDMASGNNLSEKIYNYLVEAGVDAENIDTMIEMLR